MYGFQLARIRLGEGSGFSLIRFEGCGFKLVRLWGNLHFDLLI